MKDRTYATAWICSVITVLWIIMGLVAGSSPEESNTWPLVMGMLFLAGWIALITGRVWAWWVLAVTLSGMSLWMSVQIAGLSLSEPRFLLDFYVLSGLGLLMFAVPLILLLSDPPQRWEKRSASESPKNHLARM